MKKLFMMALLISTTCLAAYKDGTYTAKEEQKKGETTWYSELVLTVKDGKISEVKIAEKVVRVLIKTLIKNIMKNG